MKILVSILMLLSPVANAYNDFGPLIPNGQEGGGLISVDLGSGTGGTGGIWFQCYGTSVENPLNYAVCGAASNPVLAYRTCVEQGWVNLTCRFTRI
jgi:hypothetical protein